MTLPADVKHYRELFASAAQRGAWLLTPTAYRKRFLRESLGELDHRPEIFTAKEAFFLLLRRLEPQATHLRDDLAETLLETLVAQAPGDFPHLSARFLFDNEEPKHSFSALFQVRYFIEQVLQNEASNEIISLIIDEHGATKADREELEEVMQLLGVYLEAQRASSRYDDTSAVSRLCELLESSASGAARKSFPARIIVDQPTELSALEARVWDSLSRITSVQFVLDAQLDRIARAGAIEDTDLPPSQRFLAEVGKYIQSAAKRLDCARVLPDERPEGRDLAAWLFDGGPLSEDVTSQLQARISVNQAGNRELEAGQAAAAAMAALASGAVEASEIHIAAADLEPYREALLREFGKRGLQLSFGKGSPLAATKPAFLLRAFALWLRQPSIDNGAAFFLDPLLNQAFPADEYNFSALQQGFSELKFALSLLGRRTDEDLNIELLDSAEAQLKRAAKLLARESQTISEAALKAARLLREELRVREALLESSDLGTAHQNLRAAFLARLRPASLFRFKGGQHELARSFYLEQLFFAQSVRELKRVFRRVRREIEMRAGGQGGTPLFFLTELLLKRITSTQVPPRLNTRTIHVSELLDLRAMRGTMVLFLGLTEDCFPARAAENPIFSPPVEATALYLAERRGRRRKPFESLLVISHVLANAKQVFFSVPAETDGQEVSPPNFVSELLTLLGTKAPCAAPAEPEEGGAERSRRALQALSARAGDRFTAYDGMLEEGAVRFERYSATVFEVLRDCPHRFFFERVLRLRPVPLELSEVLPSIVGETVHKALELFFKALRDPVTPENFQDMSRKLLSAAEEALALAPVDWDAHPLLRSAREKMIAGLGADAQAKRGTLQAALYYQQEFIKTLPYALEMYFGGADALKLETRFGTVEVTGVIDRVDREVHTLPGGEVQERFKLWDYKTGKVPASVAAQEKLLQLPLYAQAFKAKTGRLPVGGGLIYLSRPNKRDRELFSVTRGVIREQLALSRSGRKYERDEAAVPLRVEAAVKAAAALHEQVVLGRLHQTMDSEGCGHCAYSTICLRDEVRLARKLEIEDGSCKRSFTLPAIRPRAEARPANLGLSPEQSAAVDISKSAAVMAGAGSGKTFVLRSRFVELILAGASVSSIAAITFTEKAAGEIRRRIESAINAALRAGEFNGRKICAAEHKLLLNARAELFSAQIGTIHSFAGRIVRADAELAGVPVYEQVLTGGAQQELIQKAVSLTLRGGGDTEVDEARSVLLEAGVEYRQLAQNLERMLGRSRELDACRSSLGLLEGLNPDKAKRRILELIELETERLRVAELEKFKSFLLEWEPAFFAWFGQQDTQQKLSPAACEHFGEVALWVRELKASLATGTPEKASIKVLVEFLQTNNSSAQRVIPGKRRNFWKELRDFLDKLDLVLLYPDSAPAAEGLRLAEAFCRLAARAQERYRSEKRRLRAVDFDDLIRGAHRLIAGKVEPAAAERKALVIERLRRTFKHIMVDEFQDTDPEQWEIVELLTAPEPDEAPQDRTLFIVGDGKQAIYGFRGGDVRVFKQALAEITRRGGASLTLHDNYRSAPTVCDFVNRFFEPLFSADFDQGGRPLVSTAVPPEPMTAKRAPGASDGLYVLVTDKNQPGFAKRKGEAAEAVNVARFVCSVLDDALQPEPQRWSALRLDSGRPQIAVLARTVKQLLLTAKALELYGVPYSISHSSGFYELPEVSQLELLLRTVSDLNDSVARTGVLRSALFGLSDLELLKLAEPSSAALRDYIAELVQPLSMLSAFGRPARLLDYALRATGLRHGYAAVGMEDSFGNIARFIERLESAGRMGSALSVRSALAWLSAQKSDPSSAPNANRSSHPVVLTTVHGAKGLEFPLVILPYLQGGSRGPGDFALGEVPLKDAVRPPVLLGINVENEDYRRTPTVIGKLIGESAAAIGASEERRVFYVACTRAEAALVLSLRDDGWSAGDEQGPAVEGLRLSAKPADWFNEISRADDPENPSEWLLGQVKDGAPVVLRRV